MATRDDLLSGRALTPQNEQHIPIRYLGGQESRPPPTAVTAGRAVQADNTSHDAKSLRRARGASKIIQSPVPASCYELDGRDTGILWLPKITGITWDLTSQTPEGWSIDFWIKALAPGEFDLATGTGDSGDRILMTGPHIDPVSSGAPAGTEGSIDLSFLQKSDGKYYFRMRWGAIVNDVDLGPTARPWWDFDSWINVFLYAYQDPTPGQYSAYSGLIQESNSVTTSILAQAEKPNVSWIAFGGSVPPWRTPYQTNRPLRCLICEVRFWDRLVDVPALTSLALQKRLAVGDTLADYGDTRPSSSIASVVDVWRLDDSGFEPTSLLATKGRMAGNRVYMSDDGLGAADRAARFDGSQGLWIPEAVRLREPPKPSANGGIPGHYLELPERTIGCWFKVDDWNWGPPQRWHRAVLFNETTPYARDLESSNPTYGTNPSEHLRIEIRWDQAAGTYKLHGWWGQLDPNSLVHPSGVPGGGGSTTTWPPPFDSEGNPPPSWNLLRSAGGFVGHLELDLGTDMGDYQWLFFAQRKFVDQGDPGNRIFLGAYRFDNLTGLWDTTPIYIDTTNGDANGERVPPDQSCHTSIKLGVININHRADVYAATIGCACPGEYGDELGDANDFSSDRKKGIYPVAGSGPGFMVSDNLESYPLFGRISSFFILSRYLSIADREKIRDSGQFSQDMRREFADSMVYSLTFDETEGNVIREMKGGDISHDQKILTSNDNQYTINTREFMHVFGHYPRPAPPWYNESPYSAEAGAVTGVLQRIDQKGSEEIYVIAQAGLYRLDRTTHLLTRLLTLPGQGGPERVSWVVDHADNIHLAGGIGRPIIITKDRTVAQSGIEPPLYNSPDNLITSATSIAGGLSVQFQHKKSSNPDDLVGLELDNGAVVGIAIGFWSDILKTRSAPGPPIYARYSDSTILPVGSTDIVKYRVLLGGLPVPRGFNASLITHWEVYRTVSNGADLLLETRLSMASFSPTTFVGYKADQKLAEPADYFRAPPPEGLRQLAVLGERMIAIGIPGRDRELLFSQLRDGTNWPPPYARSLEQTQAPGTAVITRRDRAFAFSRDYMYQVRDNLFDQTLEGAGAGSPIEVTPLYSGVGALSRHAVADDNEHGIYPFGNKSVYLTEGGVVVSVTQDNDSGGTGTTSGSWSYPDLFDLSDPDQVVAFHDERRRMVGLSGPALDDPNRRDAILIFYENKIYLSDGRQSFRPEVSRVKGLGLTCAAEVLNPTTGQREVWFGTDLGYVLRMGQGLTVAVDYDWLSAVPTKYGLVMAVIDSTRLRLEASISGYPADLFRGATLRIMRGTTEISSVRVISATTSDSWVDVTCEAAHLAVPGDEWAVGALPMVWKSGELDFGSALQDKRVLSVDVRMRV